jgi:hypothetical protein
VLGLRIVHGVREREREEWTDWKAWEKAVGSGNEQARVPVLEALRGGANGIGGRIGHGVGPTPDFSCSQETREQI